MCGLFFYFFGGGGEVGLFSLFARLYILFSRTRPGAYCDYEGKRITVVQNVPICQRTYCCVDLLGFFCLYFCGCCRYSFIYFFRDPSPERLIRGPQLGSACRMATL